MQKLLFAAFREGGSADRAFSELEAHGFIAKDLSIISKENKDSGPIANTASGAAGGVVTGGVLGGLAGFLAGAGVFPALAGFLVGGPIAIALGLTGVAATAVTGAVTGAVAGGLIGALMGLGFTRPEAEEYSRTIEEGGLLLVIPVDEMNESEARAVLAANHAEQMRLITTERYHRTDGEVDAVEGASSRAAATHRVRDTRDATMDVHEAAETLASDDASPRRKSKAAKAMAHSRKGR